jgi:restriction system protein
MNENLILIGKYQTRWSSNGSRILSYSSEIIHKGLDDKKYFTSRYKSDLDDKINKQVEIWKSEWSAVIQNREAKQAISNLEEILQISIERPKNELWDSLKKDDQFKEEPPYKPKEKIYKDYPPEPKKKNIEFGLLDKISKKRKQKKIDENENSYKLTINKWKEEIKKTEEINSQIKQEEEKELKNWKTECSEWEKRKAEFAYKQEKHNNYIDQLIEKYLKRAKLEVEQLNKMALEKLDFNQEFPCEFELEYNPDNKILIVEYFLPSKNLFPNIKEVKFIKSKKEITQTYISNKDLESLYDASLYQITLSCINEVFKYDDAKAIEMVSFNGWVRSMNKATGNEEINCVLSIQVKKGEFEGINFLNVDPKACFKSLKGISSSKLSALTPIQPIVQISREDKRFVESYGVAGEIDTSTNLAAMDWEDFEHLIRELFEKEFQTNGGEVKVTQASRDGGVDAIAFDPDPIRGGKIVIQAKRYTNTVGVSAVRDLYGTVMNEGATKGILVTTADYGPDAYSFAKGKPLTLLNGGNLLHLLEKHGHHAKIDIKEAKKILAEKE